MSGTRHPSLVEHPVALDRRRAIRAAAPFRSVAAAAATLLAACATARTDANVPRRVAGQTVQTWQADVPGTDSKAVYVRNDGTQPIIVSEIRLSNCVNVRQVCKTYTPDGLVAAGATVAAFRIDPADDRKPFSFSYEYRWRGAPRP